MRIRISLAVLAGITVAAPINAQTGNRDVTLRADYRDGVHYTTVKRGGITEELYVSAEAVAAARAGEPFPEGTVITMDDFRDGGLYRILVMEKRAEWSDKSLSGSWLFREFSAGGTPKLDEDGTRCQSCHASQAEHDFVFTRDRMLD